MEKTSMRARWGIDNERKRDSNELIVYTVAVHAIDRRLDEMSHIATKYLIKAIKNPFKILLDYLL
jgi:hypothetical protein